MDNIEKYYDISLSKEKKEKLYTEYKKTRKEIENEFYLKTSLNRKDLSFLFFAIALQVTRQYFLTGTLGESFDKSERLDHNDKTIKKEVESAQKEYLNKHQELETDSSKKGYKTWEEIVVSPVPYDIITGSKEFNLGLGGTTHRRLTLGHDPILGWIFGTMNILTDSITLTNFSSYKVNMTNPKPRIEAPVLTSQVFLNGFESIMEEKYRLPAAIFIQGVHLKSDKFTKSGIGVPLVSSFSKELSGKLYKNQYDYLCSIRDIKTVGKQAAFSILINMIIGLVHGLYNTGKTDEEIKLYEIKTRKILLYSNIIASTSNLIQSYVSKDIRKLDLGGLMVTIYRIATDIHFMEKIEREFVNTKLSEQYQKEIKKLDDDIEEILKELNLK